MGLAPLLSPQEELLLNNHGVISFLTNYSNYNIRSSILTLAAFFHFAFARFGSHPLVSASPEPVDLLPSLERHFRGDPLKNIPQFKAYKRISRRCFILATAHVQNQMPLLVAKYILDIDWHEITSRSKKVKGYNLPLTV